VGNSLEIKPFVGFASLPFGATMAESEKVFGKAAECKVLDDIEDFKSTVWHYWDNGFSLFFDENNERRFCCVEIDNEEVLLWGHKVFDYDQKEIIEMFQRRGIMEHEIEEHEWGEKRLTFDQVNIDFYFEKNKLISINYGKAENEPAFFIHLN
jgi:hypothetical protein